jgi:hypothetical protein
MLITPGVTGGKVKTLFYSSEGAEYCNTKNSSNKIIFFPKWIFQLVYYVPPELLEIKNSIILFLKKYIVFLQTPKYGVLHYV